MYVYDAETKQPVAGVPVVLFVRSTLPNLVPVMHSGGGTGCDTDFYGVTDANGLVDVPYFSLFVWWRPSFNARSPLFYANGYQRGHHARLTKQDGISGAGHNAHKSGTLRVEMAMVKDSGTLYDRARYLIDVSAVGCGCADIHGQIANELQEISLPAEREEAKRRGQPDLGGRMSGPRRDCKEKK